MKATPDSRLSTIGVLVAVLVGAVGAGGISTSGAPFAARLLGNASPAERLDRPTRALPPPAGPTGTTAPSTTVSFTPTAAPSSAPETPTASTTPSSTSSRPTPTTTKVPSSTRPPRPPSADVVLRVLFLVNETRLAVGCQALTEDSRLETAAQLHSSDMADRNYFSHDTPEGETFDQRERAAGYPSPGGENIAQGFRGADEVTLGWLQSPGHRRNILDCSFTTMGLGLDTHGWYWTQDFGR
jgi:uncharacterized protein YkwD